MTLPRFVPRADRRWNGLEILVDAKFEILSLILISDTVFNFIHLQLSPWCCRTESYPIDQQSEY
jgi:hypothetical protein